jgi:outer membrane protein assembly factor BamB
VESQSESFTAGLDPATGKNRWRIERPRTSNWTSPVVFREPGGRTLVLLLSSNGLAAVDARDGSPVWSHGDKGSTVPSVTASGGRLYVPSNGLAVLEPVAGAAPKEVWRSTQLRTGTPSPVVLGNRVFLLNDGGILSCGDATDGKRLWQLRLDGPFSATPVVAGGLLYCVNEKGVVQVVDPSKPEGERVATLNLGQTVIATPSIASNSLFVRSDGRLWRIGRGSPL